MKFQELLAAKQINWERVKLIRHNLTNEAVAANYEQGYLGQHRTENCVQKMSLRGKIKT